MTTSTHLIKSDKDPCRSHMTPNYHVTATSPTLPSSATGVTTNNLVLCSAAQVTIKTRETSAAYVSRCLPGDVVEEIGVKQEEELVLMFHHENKSDHAASDQRLPKQKLCQIC